MNKKQIISKLNSLNSNRNDINNKLLDIMDQEIALKEALRDLHKEIDKLKFSLKCLDSIKK
jgi:predicted nuclease with TOPRIM domain